MNWAAVKKVAEYSFFLSLTVVVMFLFFRNFLSAGYPNVLSDSFGHLFKVWKIWKFGYVDWAKEWYTGYPFERFYPPLAYLVGGLYSWLFGSDLLGYKLVTFTAMGLSPITAFLSTRKMGMNFYQSSAVAVLYAFSIWNIRIPIDEGGFARYLATALTPLLPLAIIAIVNVKAGTKALLAAGLLIGVMIITHHSLLLTAMYASVFVAASLLIPKFRNSEFSFSKARRILVNLGIVSLVAFAVASFWLVPFLADLGYSSFRAENNVPELFKSQSNSLSLALTYMVPRYSTMITYHALFYDTLIIAAPLVALLNKNRRVFLCTVAIALAYWLAIGFSLGVNGPFASFEKLPIAALVPANRWLDAISLPAAFQGAFLIGELQKVQFNFKKARWVIPLIWVIILLVPTCTVLGYSASYKTINLPTDFMQTMQFVKVNIQPNERYYQYGLEGTVPTGIANSIVGYTPALTGASTVDGWYRQGDPLDQQRIDLYWSVTEAPQAAKQLLDAYNVKYVILNSNDPLYQRAKEGLASIGFAESFSQNSYCVMSIDQAINYVNPIARILAIGDEWVIKTTLDSSTLQVSYMGTTIPSDFGYETAKKYDIVVLQGYNYQNLDWVAGLRKYMEEGGIVVVDPFKSPDQNSDNLLGLEMTARTVNVNGSIESKDMQNNASWTSNYSWQGDYWGGCTYQGTGITDILTIGNYTGIGTVQAGKGELVMLGLNLLFHGLHSQDMRNVNLLVSTLHANLNSTATSSTVYVTDGNITFNYSSTRPATFRVSETWFPHWNILINSQLNGHPIEDPKSGVMLLQLPAGTDTVNLTFNDPFITLRPVSAMAVILLLAFLVIPNRHFGTLSKKRRRIRSTSTELGFTE